MSDGPEFDDLAALGVVVLLVCRVCGAAVPDVATALHSRWHANVIRPLLDAAPTDVDSPFRESSA